MADAYERNTGRCLCGACVFELIGPPNWVGNCHRRSCRKATASPFTTYIGQQNTRWSMRGDDPVVHHSSPGTSRAFCGRCGSPLYYESTRYPDERHFFAALMDEPDRYPPEEDAFTDEKLAWVHLPATLPAAG